MPLESTLDDIVAKLNERDFPDEAAISTGIVLRVLGDLNWPVHEHRVVWPEYKTMNGRVDYALCDPPSKPVVFVEVKQQGMAEANTAIKQALHYAFDEGVPFVVLTDGQTWSFFLPMERGSYEDRRVFKLDLCESSSQESKSVLARYLEHGRVASGTALDVARKEHTDQSRRETALRMLPEAWANLVRRPDGTIARLLSDTVESQTNIRLADTDIHGFLRSLTSSGVVGNIQESSDVAKPTESGQSHQDAVIVAGIRHGYKSRVGAMVTVLNELQNQDHSFLDRLVKHPELERWNRTIVARNPANIYPEKPHLLKRVRQLQNGWFVRTVLNSKDIKKIIKIAAEIGGVHVEWDPPI